jgi:hypothetical protein
MDVWERAGALLRAAALRGADGARSVGQAVRRVPWNRMAAGLLALLAAVGTAFAAGGRAAGRVLPVRGLAIVAAGLGTGACLVAYLQRWTPLDDAPYLYGAVLGILAWLPLLWATTTFWPGRLTLAQDLGLAMFAALFGLPLLCIGLLGTANVALDDAPPVIRSSVLAEPVPRLQAAAGAALLPILLRPWRPESSEPLRLEVQAARFAGLPRGTSVRVVTGRGALGWEYLIGAEPVAPRP